MGTVRPRERAFTSLNSRVLEQRGLTGDVRVSLSGTTLSLAGDEGGSLDVPAASVDRLRLFRMERVHGLTYNSPCMYELKLW